MASKRPRWVWYVTADGPLSHKRVMFNSTIRPRPGLRLEVLDSGNYSRHEIELVDVNARTAKWIRALGSYSPLPPSSTPPDGCPLSANFNNPTG